MRVGEGRGKNEGSSFGKMQRQIYARLKNFRIPTPSSFVLERDYAELLFRIETPSALGSIFFPCKVQRSFFSNTKRNDITRPFAKSSCKYWLRDLPSGSWVDPSWLEHRRWIRNETEISSASSMATLSFAVCFSLFYETLWQRKYI